MTSDTESNRQRELSFADAAEDRYRARGQLHYERSIQIMKARKKRMHRKYKVMDMYMKGVTHNPINVRKIPHYSSEPDIKNINIKELVTRFIEWRKKIVDVHTRGKVNVKD